MKDIESTGPRCPTCGYLLYGLTTPRCPECGRDFGTIGNMKRAGELEKRKLADQKEISNESVMALTGIVMIVVGMGWRFAEYLYSMPSAFGMQFRLDVMLLVATFGFIWFYRAIGEPLHGVLLCLGIAWIIDVFVAM